jgi:hypothetical protein
VLELPGIRRYVQNDVIRRPSRVPCDGIVELWFDDAAALQCGVRQRGSRALPLDEANFLGGKIVSGRLRARPWSPTSRRRRTRS